MPRQKNNFLNAKPVSKMGGGSGGVRKPSKPYKKPSASSKPKPKPQSRPATGTSGKPVQMGANNWPKGSGSWAEKPKPSVQTKPVTRSGPVKGPVPPKGSSAVSMPNSRRAGVNLPKVGASVERSTTQGPSLRGTTSKPQKPSTSPPKPAAKPSASKPNPYTSGKPNPNAGVRGVVGAKPKPGAVTRGGRAALGTGMLTAITAKAADVLGKAANPKEWERVSAELKDRGYGSNGKPVNKDANGRSSTGVRVSDKANQREYKAAPTGSQQYNDYRNKQLAEERERLKGVGNPPAKPAAKPQPAPAPRPAGTQPSRTSAPAAPKDRRVSASTANRESGNYGTSRTNNPLLKDMTDRMRQREDRQGVGPMRDGARYAADVKNTTQGVGPLKDGPSYGSNLQKAIDDMKRRKKEQDAKKK